MSTIESAGSSVIRVFRRMERPPYIHPVAKRIFAVYLNMFLWQRSPAVRDSQVAETSKEVLSEWAHEEMRLRDVLSGLHREVSIAVAKAAGDVNGLMAGHWKSSTFQRWLFYSMSWTVLRCTEPIVTVPDQGLVHLGSRGLLDPKAEFYFPLSSTRVLVASWHGAPPNMVQLISASPAHVRQINKLGFGQAGRFVYGKEHSEKLAATVLKPSRHLPTLRALRIAGGPNQTAAALGKLGAWYEKLGSNDSDRYWCMAPGAGELCRHNWQRAPFELPVVSEKPEITTPVDVCEWCGALERRYRNGHVEFDDRELRRMSVQPPEKNWWQLYDVIHGGGRIEARGTMPRYRVAD